MAMAKFSPLNSEFHNCSLFLAYTIERQGSPLPHLLQFVSASIPAPRLESYLSHVPPAIALEHSTHRERQHRLLDGRAGPAPAVHLHRDGDADRARHADRAEEHLSLIHISEP